MVCALFFLKGVLSVLVEEMKGVKRLSGTTLRDEPLFEMGLLKA